MRIADAYTKQLADQAAATASAQATSAASAASAASKGTKAAKHAHHHEGHEGVKVTVSAEARELAAKADEGFDAAKVERLKSSIDAGTYKIDPRALAARIAEKG
jgi:flagellar biosynthesis anti-sigma factor FlgM